MARHRKRLAILLLAYAGAVCAAFSGWFGGRAFEIITASPGLMIGQSVPEQVWAFAFLAGAVVLGLVFLRVVERLVPADPPPERK